MCCKVCSGVWWVTIHLSCFLFQLSPTYSNVLSTPTIISSEFIIIIDLNDLHGLFQSKTVNIQMPREEFDLRPWVTQYVSQEEVLEIKMAFDLFDLDHGGSIDPKQLKQAIHSLGIEAKAAAVYQMIAELDKDGSGQIQFDQFYEMMTHKPNQQESREQIHKIFIMFDINKTGFIGLKELRKVSKELGELADDFFLQEMIERADMDGDSQVSEEQFYNLMTKKAQ